MQPSSSVCLLDWFVSAGFPRVSGVPKNTAEEYTAIPDLPALRTSYPGAAVVEDGGEEEIRTLWIPSKASMSLSEAPGKLLDVSQMYCEWHLAILISVGGECQNAIKNHINKVFKLHTVVQ